ncbi:hypothetical protein LTS07_009086 [Exophiala sideris]|uniref:Zn(2)-C6 fungal-type domain-containing protein n=1 Tax=Exophiala sideris TaxID=1016849 RepID=A0ABR0J0H3_9EURO|nr:hypothetical protein LTS07_009086 [Exophiala sideris]KAK5029578.1 hypothetical protein LTR13_008498 [Exophiala sideris]KAK5053367.1 hypothetical protein LTR69_009325 [Exophiala sideris]KAK5179125.1 hypothetical protein LTR44_008279 [Eurotiomycetes sp. CCFEE 6388]
MSKCNGNPTLIHFRKIRTMLALTPPSECDGGRIPKACLPCARAKVRCRRLRKNCTEQAPGAHRHKTPGKAKVARLEEKLNGVTSILAASQLVTSGLNPLLASGTPDCAPSAWIDIFVRDESEANAMLEIYRSEMQPLFPFVVTSPDITYTELRQEKPLFVLAIMMVSCRHDQSRQIAIARKLRELISYTMLVKGERSLDILQCLLVYLSWYQIHVDLSSQVGNLVHLIMAMTTDLCLNKGNFSPAPAAQALRNPKVPAPRPNTRTLEERRTFLGAFFLTSIASTCHRDMYPIQHSPYVDECCQAISAAAEYSTDIDVVHLTRLHGMADKIFHSLTPDIWQRTPIFGSAPLGACVKSIQLEMLELNSSFPAGGGQNSLYDHIGPSRYGTYPLSRLHILYACLESTKRCFETAYTVPPSQWFDLPWSFWSLLGHAIVVLSKLSLLRFEEWDQEYVRRTMDFCGAMDALQQQLDTAKDWIESQSSQNGHDRSPRVIPQLYSTFSAKLKRVKIAHEAKSTAQPMNVHLTSDSSSSDTLTIPTDDTFGSPSATFFGDFLHESLWEHFT